MRYMMLMYPDKMAEQGVMPSAEIISAMMKYNEDLTGAGVLLALDGLHPSSKGTRVKFENGKPTVTDGPFTETKEIVGGYWMINVQSKEEAVDWASRCPTENGTIEVRRVFEMEDFAPETRDEAAEKRVVDALTKVRWSGT